MFSERIVQLRKARGLTQEEVAEAVGITRAALSHYEKGRREPDFDMVMKFAEFFNVSTDYLLGLSEEPQPEDIRHLTRFAERLRASRERKALTIQELAERTGVTPEYLQTLESHPSRYPGVSTLNKLASALDVTAAYLVGDVSDPTNHGPNDAWYQPKDLIKFLEESEVMFEGQPLNDEDKQRIKDILAAVFRDAKQRNKRR